MRPIDRIDTKFRRLELDVIDRSHISYPDSMDPIDSAAALGGAIRRRRVELKITQDDLAMSIGVNRKVIGQLEGGKKTVRLDIALSAARALGLNVGVEARGEAGP